MEQQQHHNQTEPQKKGGARAHTGRNMLIRITATGAMVALSVIFCRYLGFPQTGIWRVEIGFLPIAFIAFLWGPLWAGVGYGASDLIGAAIFTGVNPFITVEKVFTGVVMGIFFYGGRRKRGCIGNARMMIAFAIIALVGDFFMMALIFKFAFGYTWGAALAFRGGNATVNFCMRTLIMWLADMRLTKRLLKEGEKYGL